MNSKNCLILYIFLGSFLDLDRNEVSGRYGPYAIEVAKIQRSQVFCVHAIIRVPYGCFLDGYAAQLYLEDTMKQAKSWFGDIIEIARQKDVSNNNGYHIEVITDIFTSVKSIVEAIVKGIVREYCQRCSSACKLSCPTCKVVFEIFGTDN